jgi:antitoxin HicB
MKDINKERLGSTLDDLLESEGELTEITAIAHKRVLAWQISEAMRRLHVNKVEMARRMHTSRAAVDRLLSPQNPSVTLDTMDRAAAALGMVLSISLVEKSVSL